jgi:hypothetical protein
VSARTVALTGLAIGAAVGLAYALNRRSQGSRVQARLADSPADLPLTLSADLARADGGYDVTDGSASALPSTIDLR